jgi:hypothetical protein
MVSPGMISTSIASYAKFQAGHQSLRREVKKESMKFLCYTEDRIIRVAFVLSNCCADVVKGFLTFV